MYLLQNSAPVNNRKWNLGCAMKPNLGCDRGCSSRGVQLLAAQKRMGALNDGGAGVPAGTILGYSGSWPFGLTKGHGAGVSDLLSRIQGPLASQWGIIVDGSTSQESLIGGTQSITLQVHTNSDYGAPADIQKIIDGVVYPQAGSMPTSTIRVIQAVAPSSTNVTAQLPGDPGASLASAQAGYADAVSRGDSASANAFAQQIVALGGKDPRGVTGWLSDNWPILAGVGIAAIAAKELL